MDKAVATLTAGIFPIVAAIAVMAVGFGLVSAFTKKGFVRTILAAAVGLGWFLWAFNFYAA